MPSDPPPTYWDYLRLDRLLALQGGLEDREEDLLPDELHFIVVHQVFELWFKLVLRELRLARDHLVRPRVEERWIPHVVHHLSRVNAILKLADPMFQVVETLTPQDFLAFRDKLTPASGFQSFQVRELEILLGMEDAHRIRYGDTDPLEHIRALAERSPTGRMAWERLQAARAETSLRAALHAWLLRTPIQGSTPEDPDDEAVVEGFLAEVLARWEERHRAQLQRMLRLELGRPEAVHARFEAAQRHARTFLGAEDVPEADRARVRRLRAALLFIEGYRDLPLLAWPRVLIDRVVELEELLVLWRTRHARMVERTIGRRVGTGGSSGVDYLDRTATVRIFPELWAVRTLLLPRSDLPPLRNEARYDFAGPG